MTLDVQATDPDAGDVLPRRQSGLGPEAANFHGDGEHLFVPEHLGELFQDWSNRVIDEHAPDEEPSEEGDPHTAMYNEFLAEHPQHIAGTRTMVVNGEGQVMADPEALRAFVT